MLNIFIVVKNFLSQVGILKYIGNYSENLKNG